MAQSVQYFRVSRLTYNFSYMSRLSRICQGRQTSRDVTVCIDDTGTQNKLLFQLRNMLCLRVFSSLGSSETSNSSQCLGTRYELSPVPHSLVDEFGYLLKGDTSVLMKRLGSDSEKVPKPNVFLVDHIVWRMSGTVADIVDSCKVYHTSGEKYQGATIFIIFA